TRTSPARRRPGSARCSSIATGATATSPPSRRSISISEMEGHEYAGFWRRALAITLDNAVWLVGIPMILGWLPIHYDHLSDLQAYIGVLVFASLWFNYFSFCEWRWGQTIGKNAVGLEVRSLDGAERLTFGQASIRNLLRLIDFFVVGELMIVTTKRQQRLGDKAARTVVVRRAPKTAPVPSGGGADPAE